MSAEPEFEHQQPGQSQPLNPHVILGITNLSELYMIIKGGQEKPPLVKMKGNDTLPPLLLLSLLIHV